MKGFAADLIVPVIFLFVLIILVVAMSLMLTSAGNTGLASFDSIIGNAKLGLYSFNSLAPIFIIGMGIALIVSAAMVRTQPALFFIFIIIQIVIIFTSIQFSNAYYSIFSGTGLSTEAAHYTLWTELFRWYPIVTMILAVIFAIAVFAKGE